jgi:hypothetical protein
MVDGEGKLDCNKQREGEEEGVKGKLQNDVN